MAKRFVNYKIKRLWYKLLYLQGHCKDVRKTADAYNGEMTRDDERDITRFVSQCMDTVLTDLEKLKALVQATDEKTRG